MEIKITISADARLENLLDRLIGALSGSENPVIARNAEIALVDNPGPYTGTRKRQAKAKPVEETQAQETPVNAPAKTGPEETTDADNFPETFGKETGDAPLYTLERVREATVAKSQENAANPGKIRAILADLNVKRVTDLTEDQYDDFMAKLKAI